MKQNKTVGRLLIICGCILALLGIILFFVKKHAIVSFMSFPLILLGVFIWLNAENKSSSPANELKDT